MPKSKSFITKLCTDCNKEFKIYFYETIKIRIERKKCRSCVRKKPNKGQFIKQGKSLKKTRLYINSHRFIKKVKGSPSKCEICKTEDTSKQYEWSNKDHKYNKNIDDYTRMCTQCHWQYDIRMGFRGKRLD